MLDNEVVYYNFDHFRLDVEKQQLLKNGEAVQLTHKAFQILLLLVQNSGQTTKKEDIFNQLWSDSFVEDGNLTQHIYVLRKVLGQTPSGQSYIETVPKQGYRFTLLPDQLSITEDHFNEKSEITSEEKNQFSWEETNLEVIQNHNELNYSKHSNFDEDVLEINGTNDVVKSPSPAIPPYKNESPRSFVVPILLLLLVLIAGTAGVYYFKQKNQQVVVDHNIKSIAVLPLRSIGKEVDKDKLGLGMADAVIMRLSKLQQIEVRPTSAVYIYTDQPASDAVSAGRDLGVDAILEGTVQTDGGRIRVTVQLVRIVDGKTLWAESFQEKVSDIFAVQDSISARVATALSINLTQQQEQLLAQRTTNSTEAFQAYQLGIYFWNKRSKEDLLKAVEYFSRAIEHDQNYAYAYAGLADSYSVLGIYGFADPNEMREKGRIAAEKSLAINDSLGEAYIALALTEIIRNDFSKAQQLLERALSLSPYNASARQRYGYLLINTGNLDQAVREMRLAQEYDPLSPTNNKTLCNALMYQGNFSEAVKFCEKAVEISPDTPGTRSSLAHSYFHAGMHDEALAQLELELKLGNNLNSTRSSLAYIYAKLGRKAEAEKIYEQLKPIAKTDKWLPLTLSPVAFALGEKDEAYDFFKKAIELSISQPEIATLIVYSPTFSEIKADPQFASIIPR